jgi:hypothetical protein
MFGTNKMENNSGTCFVTFEGTNTHSYETCTGSLSPSEYYSTSYEFEEPPVLEFGTNSMENNSGTSSETEGKNMDWYEAHAGSVSSTQSYGTQYEFEEPPLLEELGINTDRIFEKCVSVLKPFHSDVKFEANMLCETDLAGPIALCILLSACLLLAGSKAHFGHVYGLVMISCIAMYILLTLMTIEDNVRLGSVASVLGYCLLPVVVLSILGIFVPLYSLVGCMCTGLAVLWSSLSASKLFVMMSGDSQQRPLIAYACILLYGAFALAVVF